MRIFAALELPEDILDAIGDWWMQASLHLDAGAWREIPRENWHLTLAFYGEVSGGEAEEIAEALHDCAARTPPLRLALDGYGVFPTPARPRVFWIGVRETGDAGFLARLARCCERAGHATLRRRIEGRNRFRAHVTLARARGGLASMHDHWERMPQPPQDCWTATGMTLFRSLLRPEGASYRRLEEYMFEEQDDVG